MYIHGIPNTIRREALLGAIKALGLDPEETLRLEISHRAVVAEVAAKSENFERFVVGEELATHMLTIEVTDDDEQL